MLRYDQIEIWPFVSRERLVSRRSFLKQAVLASALLGLSQIPDRPPRRYPILRNPDRDEVQTKLGFNLVPEQFKQYGLDEDQTLDKLLKIPSLERVRIAVRFSDVYKNGAFDPSYSDKLINKTLDAGKIIDIQFGMKTFGATEVNLPDFLTEKYPYLNQDFAKLDAHPDVRKYTLEYLVKVAERYLKIPEVKTIHVENEPFSRLLDVTRFKYLSFDFNMEEIGLVKSLDPLDAKRPIVQNFPWDAPWVWNQMLESGNIDILGVNVYNNIYPEWGNKLLWRFINYCFEKADQTGKQVIITEYQTASWLDGNLNPSYPFSYNRLEHGMDQLKRLKPHAIHLWDLGQHFWQAQKGNETSSRVLSYYEITDS